MLNYIMNNLLFAKGLAVKGMYLGGGALLLSLGTAAWKKPDYVIDKTEQFANSAYNSAYGFVNSLFHNTREVVGDITGSCMSGVNNLYSFVFGTGDTAIDIPEIKAPTGVSYSWWDLFSWPLKVVQDSFVLYKQWAPVELDLVLLQNKTGFLLPHMNGDTSQPLTMWQKMFHVYTNNMYRKNIEVENILSEGNSKIYVSRWIAESYKEGLQAIDHKRELLSELSTKIDALIFVVLLISLFLILTYLFQGSGTLMRQLLVHLVESGVNRYQTRKISGYRLEERLNMSVKPFSFKLAVEKEFEKPIGLRGFFARVADAINVINMFRRNYIKILLGTLVARLVGQLYSFTILIDEIVRDHTKLLGEMFQSMNVCVLSTHDQASYQFLLTKLLELGSDRGYLEFYIHNAPHHRILLGFLLSFGAVSLTKGGMDGFALLATSLQERILGFINKRDSLPYERPHTLSSTEAQEGTGGDSGDAFEVDIMRTSHPVPEPREAAHTSFDPVSPGDSPSQTMLRTRIEQLKEKNPESSSLLQDMTQSITDVYAEMHKKLENAIQLAPQTTHKEEILHKTQTIAESNLAFLSSLGGWSHLPLSSLSHTLHLTSNR